jgi:hypothetical protein
MVLRYAYVNVAPATLLSDSRFSPYRPKRLHHLEQRAEPMVRHGGETLLCELVIRVAVRTGSMQS